MLWNQALRADLDIFQMSLAARIREGSRRRVGVLQMYRVDFSKQRRRDWRLCGRQGFLELLQAGSANDGAGDKRARADKSQGQLGWRQVMTAGQSGVGANGGLYVNFAVALTEFWPFGQSTAGARVVQIFAGQVAKSERRVGEQANLFAVTHLGEPGFIGSVE